METKLQVSGVENAKIFRLLHISVQVKLSVFWSIMSTSLIEIETVKFDLALSCHFPTPVQTDFKLISWTRDRCIQPANEKCFENTNKDNKEKIF